MQIKKQDEGGSLLPKYEDLLLDPEESFKNDQFNALVNKEPKKDWLKKHPASTADKPIWYLPIDKVEYLLIRVFGVWSVEVMEFKQLANSISVSVRLHVRHPLTGEKLFYDGVGAVHIQVNKGSSPADLAQIKNNAIQLALPAAKSYAIKDAAEHIGKLFGRDTNRENTVMSGEYEKRAARWGGSPEKTEEDNIREMLSRLKTFEQLNIFQDKNPEIDVRYYDERRDQLREEAQV